MNKYNIHLLIYKNNLKKIKEIVTKIPKLIYAKDYNNEAPIHIACRLGFEKIIDFFYSMDNKILTIKNNYYDTGYHLLTKHSKILQKYLLVSNKKMINYTNKFDITPVIKYILENNNIDKKILQLFYKKGADINIPTKNPQFSKIIYQKEGYNKFKLIFEIFKNININLYDNHGLPAIFYATKTNNLNFIKLLVKNNADYNATTMDGTNDIFSFVLKYSPNNIIIYFLTLNLDFKFINSIGNTYLHTILYENLLRKKKFKKEIIELLIKKTNINHQNIYGYTPIHLKNKLKILDKYKKLIYEKDIDYNLKNKDNVKISEILKPANNKLVNKDDIKIMKLNKVKKTLFISGIKDMLIYNLYLIKKYQNLGMPICKNTKNYKLKQKLTDYIDFKFGTITNIIRSNNMNLECSLISWHNKNLNFTCNGLRKCLKNVINKDYIIINLILINKKINHANIILIDNKIKTVERFDPYGITRFNDFENLDKYIKKNIHSLIENLKKGRYEYLPPKKYLSANIFQSLSQENNNYNSNSGEIEGLCLAWCYWYAESRITNPKIHPKNLIPKLNKKLINNNISIMEYIRSYSSKIDNERNKILKKLGLQEHEFYKNKIHSNKLKKLYNDLYIKFANILLK